MFTSTNDLGDYYFCALILPRLSCGMVSTREGRDPQNPVSTLHTHNHYEMLIKNND